MVSRRRLLTAVGVLLTSWCAVAWFIDRKGGEGFDSPGEGQEVIVVLGARVNQDGRASLTLRTRVEHAVALLSRRPGAVLLFSGGIGTWGSSEASVARALAISLGVDAARCLVEEESHSTSQNAQFSVRLLEARYPLGFYVTVVTDPYHLVRARMVFEHAGAGAVSGSPVVEAPRHRASIERVWWALREVPAFVKDY